METIQSKPAKQPKKKLSKEVILLGVAVIATLGDIALDIAVGDAKSSPLGITSDIFHIISIAAILSMFFVNNGWNRLHMIQKPLVVVSCAGYSIGAIEELMRHVTGIETFTLFGIACGFLGIVALIAVVIIGQTKKSKR